MEAGVMATRPTGKCVPLQTCRVFHSGVLCHENKPPAPQTSFMRLSQGSPKLQARSTIAAVKQQQSRKSKTKPSPPQASGRMDQGAGEGDRAKGFGQVPQTESSASQTKAAAMMGGRGTASEEEDATRQHPVAVLPAASREVILKACVATSTGLAVAGLGIRQASHWAAEVGWMFPDCTVLMPYDREVWHLGAAAGVVVSIALMRQLLLLMWPEFAQSSLSANQQVLGPLEPADYLVVSFLPGISEELLFRGALLPLIGQDWRGVAFAGIVFGVLHVTGSRNAAFAVWASFVGVVYGLAAVFTSDLAVPMCAHSFANLAAAVLWRLREEEESKTPL